MKVYVDANPSRVCYVITPDGVYKETAIVELVSGYTNNEAEYKAVLEGLHALQKVMNNPDIPIEVLSDSQLIVNQLNHKWSIKEDRLRLLATSIWDYVHYIGLKVTFTWVPRDENLAGKVLG